MNSCCRPRSRSEARLPEFGWRVLVVLALLAGTPVHAGPGSESAGASGAYSIIVGPGVQITDLALRDVSRLLLGERRFWRSDLPVVVLVPPSGSAARRFLFERVFHMTEQAYRRHTLELLYRGELDYAPKVVASIEDLVAFTAASAGAISIVPTTQTLPATVRVLRVDGRLAGAPGYALER